LRMAGVVRVRVVVAVISSSWGRFRVLLEGTQDGASRQHRTGLARIS
jgi:hypothetical protein